jgi:hypothetical protein
MPTGSRSAAPPAISRAPELDGPAPGAAAAHANDEVGTVVTRSEQAVGVPAAPERSEASNVVEEREPVRDIPDSHIEELGDRLFDHIRTRLRAELLVDRERAGLIGDLR